MYLPPILRPLPAAGPVPPTVDRIAEAPYSVVRGVPGSYVAERLATAIDGWQRLRDCVWLRTDDRDSAELARSISTACRYRWFGAQGPSLHGAQGPFPHGDVQQHLGEDIANAPDGAVIVVELGSRACPGLGHLLRTIRPSLTHRAVNVVAVVESRWPLPAGRAPDCVLPATGLLDAAEYVCPPSWDRARLLAHARRRPALAHDLVAAARVRPTDAVAEALAASRSTRTFLNRVTDLLLEQVTPAERTALDVAAATGYWHPRLGTDSVEVELLRPWLVPLEQQWGWLRPIWRTSLRRGLARGVRHPGRPLVTGPTPRSTSTAAVPEEPPAARPAVRAPARTAEQPRLLEGRLLGPFEVRIDGAPVTSWTGQRGVSVLRYLLARHHHACSRDELLAEFWPEVAPSAARNRLQVAVSGLRRAFADLTTLNVVEYANGSYRLNPQLQVEVDVDGFEREFRSGTAAERAGDREEARQAYRRAIALHRGDFAVDAPFEQWTLLPRESLRIKMVDALDRLSRIELADGRLDDCITTAHRMLDIDPCCEDAHRLLIRCYAAQGRVYQALRQYELCSRLLRATVGADPSPETRRLYQAVRDSSTP